MRQTFGTVSKSNRKDGKTPQRSGEPSACCPKNETRNLPEGGEWCVCVEWSGVCIFPSPRSLAPHLFSPCSSFILAPPVQLTSTNFLFASVQILRSSHRVTSVSSLWVRLRVSVHLSVGKTFYGNKLFEARFFVFEKRKKKTESCHHHIRSYERQSTRAVRIQQRPSEMQPPTFFSTICSCRQFLIWSYFLTSILPLVS